MCKLYGRLMIKRISGSQNGEIGKNSVTFGVVDICCGTSVSKVHIKGKECVFSVGVGIVWRRFIV